jgi:hypothetical protein
MQQLIMTTPVAPAPIGSALPAADHAKETVGHTHTLFETEQWLDAVAPGTWDAVKVEEHGRIVARLPYVIKKRPGLKVLSVPPVTPWLGPWLAPCPGKYHTQLARQHELMRKLIDQLPRTDAAFIPAAPEQTNLLPFHWQGFELKFGYTYRISLDRPINDIWQNTRQTTRNAVRKAAQNLLVAPSDDVDKIVHLIAGTYERQGLAAPPIAATIARVLQAPALRRHRELLLACDRLDQVHAFVMLAFDDRHTFYVAGGADPLLRSSAAQSLLLWRAIERSHGRSAVFDFEGSMNQDIERSFRSYGAIQTPRITAVAERTLLGRAYRFYTQMRSRMTQPNGLRPSRSPMLAKPMRTEAAGQ